MYNYFILLLSFTHAMSIDCAVGTPRYGKYLIDGLNVVDKYYLRKCEENKVGWTIWSEYQESFNIHKLKKN